MRVSSANEAVIDVLPDYETSNQLESRTNATARNVFKEIAYFLPNVLGSISCRAISVVSKDLARIFHPERMFANALREIDSDDRVACLKLLLFSFPNTGESKDMLDRYALTRLMQSLKGEDSLDSLPKESFKISSSAGTSFAYVFLKTLADLPENERGDLLNRLNRKV